MIILLLFAIVGIFIIGCLVHTRKQDRLDEQTDVFTRVKESARRVVNSVPDGDHGFALLRQRFNVQNMHVGTSTFTTGKKDMTVCVRDMRTNTLYDEQLLLFPVLHEMAHMCVQDMTNNHGLEFQLYFKRLLDIATSIGVYSPHNFAKDPEPYCGMVISTMPMD